MAFASFRSFSLNLLYLAGMCKASLRGSGLAALGDEMLVADNAAPLFIGTDNIKSSLADALQTIGQGGDSLEARRQAKIEASIWQTFESLPKNELGRLTPRGVRYIVHNYFEKQHGWLIKGLEPHGYQEKQTDVHDATILQDKIPFFVERLVEARQSDRGLSLSDVVVMVAVLETIVVNEFIALLARAYSFNDLSTMEAVDEETLKDVIMNFLLIHKAGAKADAWDKKTFQRIKVRLAGTSHKLWMDATSLQIDAVENSKYTRRSRRNPFQSPQYSFEDSSEIVHDIIHGIGKSEQMACAELRETLVSLSPKQNGRVPLSNFYRKSNASVYQFSETLDYLRGIGALDEAIPKAPQVLVANYAIGPSNCNPISPYFSACCKNTCESLLNEIESAIQAPSASPEWLLSVVGNLSQDVRPEMWEFLTEKLYLIAQQAGGVVHLHSRLFAQWLHHAFPNDCPYPHIIEEAGVLSPSHWKGHSSLTKKNATELNQLADSALESEAAAALAWSDMASLSGNNGTMLPEEAWSDTEVLFLHDGTRHQGVFSQAVRMVAALAMLGSVISTAAAAWTSTTRCVSKKDDNSVFKSRVEVFV